jgi:hypothetical protein
MVSWMCEGADSRRARPLAAHTARSPTSAGSRPFGPPQYKKGSAMNLVDWLWTLLVFFFMVMYFILLFRIIVDIFRSDDLSGWGKAGWLIFLFVFTLLAALIYVIARGKSMTERDMAQYKQAEAAQADYIRSVAAPAADPTTQIKNAHDLLSSGAISQEEFDAIKAKALAS